MSITQEVNMRKELSAFLRSVMQDSQKIDFSIIYSEYIESKKFCLKVRAMTRREAIREFLKLYPEYVIWSIASEQIR